LAAIANYRKTNAQKFDDVLCKPEKNQVDLDTGQVISMLAGNPELLSDLRNLLIKTAI